jgi:dCMP deaminase
VNIKSNLYHFYYQTAERVAELSYAKRRRVGSCIVTKNGSTFTGYNGTIPNFPNICENEDGSTNEAITIHSEQNALYKMLREGVSAEGATVFCTTSCCAQCSKMLISAGIERFVYGEEYRDTTPLQILRKAGIFVEKYDPTI